MRFTASKKSLLMLFMIFFIAVFISAGCGKKALPKPPEGATPRWSIN